MGKKLKRGKLGNAAQYITRTQAIRKLQLRLSEFRRLCILKGVHPREPKKKPRGANKTYYHVKDINWLAHEPLLNTFRNLKSYDKKVRKARAKQNRDLAQRLLTLKPTYKLDHLVKERYPSFIDALRDLDDPLTLVHLFATLPAEKKYEIPVKAVHTARRLALEWQAYVLRAHALRRVFVSVKGYYFQADIMGQSVTWLVPHQLAQVLPSDVDYRVMLTFLEFYNTLLQFVNFKMYHVLGLRYPPLLDAKLEEAAADLAAVMKDLAGVRDTAEEDRAAEAAALTSGDTAGASSSDPLMQERIVSLQTRLREIVGQEEAAAGAAGVAHVEGDEDDADEEEVDSEAGADDDDDDAALEIDSGGDDDDESSDEDDSASTELDASARSHGRASTSFADLDRDEDDEDDDTAADQRGADLDLGQRAAGGALGPVVDPNDEAAICGSLFRGLVFFLSREVPREPLMLVIRAFGGVAAWDGEGSPHTENDEVITHQVVDRPTQGHKFLSRDYIQPQWVFDSANFRVLISADLYAPAKQPPPHLSPFAHEDDEGYTPDFAKTVKKLQDAARSARLRAAGVQLQGADGSEFVGEGRAAEREEGQSGPADEVDMEAAEKVYAAELAKEVRAAAKRPAPEGGHKAQGQQSEDDDEQEDEAEVVSQPLPTKRMTRKSAAAAEAEEALGMADIMMTRKAKKMYQGLQNKAAAKRQRVETLESKKAQLQKK